VQPTDTFADIASQAVPQPPIKGGGVSSALIPSGPAAFSLPPVVLRVLPLRGSSAPVGFIYDASPDPVDGGLVAVVSAFFSHQGHQVFHDPCPNLEAYSCSMGVPPSMVVYIDRLPDYLLHLGLEILAGLAAPSPTDAALAAQRSWPHTSLPLLRGSACRGLLVLRLRWLGQWGVSPHFWLELPHPPRSPSRAGLAFQGFHMVIKSKEALLFWVLAFQQTHMVRPHPVALPPLRLSSGARFQRSVPPSTIRMSACTDPGGFRGGSRPSAIKAPPASGPAPARRPDPDEDVPLPPSSGCGSFPSSVSLGGFRSGSSVGGLHGDRSSSSFSGSRGGLSSSVPSLGRPACSPASAYDGSGDLSTVDDLSISISRASIRGGSPPPVRVLSPDVPLVPIPVPTDRFTLPPIKSTDDYLQTRDVLLFWLRSLGFSAARSDELLLMDARNALASLFWEGQLWAAIKDEPTRFLFKNKGTTFYGKGFEMLQVLKDHFCPSTNSNSFTALTALLSLFSDTQGNKESIHEFWSRFEGHMGALSCLLVAIPPILQVMLFLRGMHSHYHSQCGRVVRPTLKVAEVGGSCPCETQLLE
jgi:hypothetical protein